MADQQSNWKKWETQLNGLGAEITELLTKMETAVGKEAEALRPKLEGAREKLDELKHTSSEAWGDLKPGLKKAWEELHKSVNRATTRFKTRAPKD